MVDDTRLFPLGDSLHATNFRFLFNFLEGEYNKRLCDVLRTTGKSQLSHGHFSHWFVGVDRMKYMAYGMLIFFCTLRCAPEIYGLRAQPTTTAAS